MSTVSDCLKEHAECVADTEKLTEIRKAKYVEYRLARDAELTAKRAEREAMNKVHDARRATRKPRKPKPDTKSKGAGMPEDTL